MGRIACFAFFYTYIAAAMYWTYYKILKPFNIRLVAWIAFILCCYCFYCCCSFTIVSFVLYWDELTPLSCLTWSIFHRIFFFLFSYSRFISDCKVKNRLINIAECRGQNSIFFLANRFVDKLIFHLFHKLTPSLAPCDYNWSLII